MSKKKKDDKSKQRAVSDPIAYWLKGGDACEVLCPKGYIPLAKNQEVLRCVHKIADTVSNMTIMLMENGDNGDQRLKNELSKKIDVYPNKNMTRKNFIYKVVSDMLVYGNCVARPEYKDGLLENITILKQSHITYKCTAEDYQIYYNGVAFDPDELLHFVWVPDADNPYIGVGCGPAIKSALDNILQAETTKTAFLQTKWKPSLIISITADLEELKDEEQRRNILGSYLNTTEIGEPWLIPAGELDIKEVKPLTLNDLSIQEGLALDKKTVAVAIGVPAYMVGVGEYKREEHNNFIATTIMSVARVIEQELTRKLVYAPTWYFKMNQKSLMQYSQNEQVAFVKEMVSGGMLNRNEGRNEFDYSPVDDEGMNEYNILENYIPVSRVGDQKKLKGGDGNEGT